VVGQEDQRPPVRSYLDGTGDQTLTRQLLVVDPVQRDVAVEA